jgi:hypothetical protein
MLGCSSIDDAINDAVDGALSGDVTTDTIILKSRAIIIEDVSRTACVTIKNGLVDAKGLKNAETLVTDMGVTCETYKKKEGELTDPDAQCVKDSLVNWLDVNKNINIDLEAAKGDKACVIGFDL